MTIGPLLEKNVVQTLHYAQIVKYTVVASATFGIVEWLALFQEEVELIWKSKWSIPKVLYLLSRYLPVIDTTATFLYQFLYELTLPQCSLLFHVIVWSTPVGFASSELIVVFRTMALYDNSLLLGCFLCALIIPIGILDTWVTFKFAKSAQFVDPPLPDLQGCFIGDISREIFASFVMLTAFEFVIILLTLYKGRSFYLRRRITGDHLSSAIYHDGLLFFFIMLLFSAASLVVFLAAPIAMVDLLEQFARLVHSTLCCRILLHLRRAALMGETGRTIGTPHEQIVMSTINSDPSEHSSGRRRNHASSGIVFAPTAPRETDTFV